jgi:hypothetical protein
MANSTGVAEYFIVVSSLLRGNIRIQSNSNCLCLSHTNLVCLISEEMYLCESFVHNMTQGIGLVPACREDVKGDLTTDRICEVVVREFLFKDFDESRTNPVLLVICFERMSFCDAVDEQLIDQPQLNPQTD